MLSGLWQKFLRKRKELELQPVQRQKHHVKARYTQEHLLSRGSQWIKGLGNPGWEYSADKAMEGFVFYPEPLAYKKELCPAANIMEPN